MYAKIVKFNISCLFLTCVRHNFKNCACFTRDHIWSLDADPGFPIIIFNISNNPAYSQVPCNRAAKRYCFKKISFLHVLHLHKWKKSYLHNSKALSKQKRLKVCWDAEFLIFYTNLNQLLAAKKGLKNEHPTKRLVLLILSGFYVHDYVFGT